MEFKKRTIRPRSLENTRPHPIYEYSTEVVNISKTKSVIDAMNELGAKGHEILRYDYRIYDEYSRPLWEVTFRTVRTSGSAKQFEYSQFTKTATELKQSGASYDEEITRIGKEGWRIVTENYNPDNRRYFTYFSREINTSNPKSLNQEKPEAEPVVPKKTELEILEEKLVNANKDYTNFSSRTNGMDWEDIAAGLRMREFAIKDAKKALEKYKDIQD